jgi:hypothetical protein
MSQLPDVRGAVEKVVFRRSCRSHPDHCHPKLTDARAVALLNGHAICTLGSGSGRGALGFKELIVHGLRIRNHLECRG